VGDDHGGFGQRVDKGITRAWNTVKASPSRGGAIDSMMRTLRRACPREGLKNRRARCPSQLPRKSLSAIVGLVGSRPAQRDCQRGLFVSVSAATRCRAGFCARDRGPSVSACCWGVGSCPFRPARIRFGPDPSPLAFHSVSPCRRNRLWDRFHDDGPFIVLSFLATFAQSARRTPPPPQK